MLISVLPGLFPIVLAGTLLWLMGQGLQFASVIALTVSFGLGLSATIHFLNRLQIEDVDPDPAIGVERATILVGPPLILTSAVLACGLAMTVLSSLPSLRLFGWLSAFAMVSALIADLFMLRPIATFLSNVARRMSWRSPVRSSARITTSDVCLAVALKRERHALDRRRRLFRLDDNGLVVAVRGYRKIGGEGRTFCVDLEMFGARLAGDRPGSIARGFGPAAGDGAGGVNGAGAQVEAVALTGATDIELQIFLLLPERRKSPDI